MTDYAKHIEGLQIINTRILPPDAQEALNTAIELMRTAAPKDAEAEREHCRAMVASFLPNTGNECAVAMLERARAAARAEGHARAATADTLFWRNADEQLSAAQAEIERLSWRIETQQANYRAVITERAERDAEIERLRADVADYQGIERADQAEIERLRATLDTAFSRQRQELATKLTERDAEIERLRKVPSAQSISLRDAEIARLRKTACEYDCVCTSGRLCRVHEHATGLQTKLTERDAEIERLRGEVAGMRLDFDLISREHTTKVQELNDEANQLEAAEYALETKLTNLRAAAERWLRERDDVEGWMRAAVEASR